MIDSKKIQNKNEKENQDIMKSMQKPIYAITKQENFDIEKIKSLTDNYNFLKKKEELEAYKNFEENKNLENKRSKEIIFNQNDNDLILSLIPSKPGKREEVNLTNAFAHSASFEINVDLLNHVTNSGGMEKLNFNILKKD